MHAALVALVFAVWAALPWPFDQAGKSPDARDVADAIAEAVGGEDSPASGESHAVDLALLAEYAARESGARRAPIPTSWDARAGLSRGVWQLRWYLVEGRSLTQQARYWLEAVKRAGVVGADSSSRRARWRTDEARRVLQQVIAQGK